VNAIYCWHEKSRGYIKIGSTMSGRAKDRMYDYMRRHGLTGDAATLQMFLLGEPTRGDTYIWDLVQCEAFVRDYLTDRHGCIPVITEGNAKELLLLDGFAYGHAVSAMRVGMEKYRAWRAAQYKYDQDMKAYEEAKRLWWCDQPNSPGRTRISDYIAGLVISGLFALAVPIAGLIGAVWFLYLIFSRDSRYAAEYAKYEEAMRVYKTSRPEPQEPVAPARFK
jgi:hypothetical protein